MLSILASSYILFIQLFIQALYSALLGTKLADSLLLQVQCHLLHFELPAILSFMYWMCPFFA